MRSLGPYTILDQLGRGGQGVVYLAEDTRLKRKVALKVIEFVGQDLPADRLERFRREAEAASKLDHPNICAIHEAGEIAGVPFIAMRYVEGETLAEQIERAREGQRSGADSTPSTRDHIQAVLARIEKVARALHFAHGQGLIHRDIKPGNIMLTGDDEPVVLDFGLARDELVDASVALTQSGDLLGTPAYMSPEQLMAQRIPLDRRTDIYSLGATLYEALTLKRPFEALTRAELYQHILTHEPSSATSINRAIPQDLRVVLETAIEKDRDRRYQTALDFAEDLRRVRDFEPIQAKPIGRLLRLKRWSQRHPAIASSSILLAVAFALTLVLLADTRSALRRSEMLRLVATSAGLGDHDPIRALEIALAAVDREETFESVSQVRNALALPMPSARLTELPDSQQRLFVAADQRRILIVENTRERRFLRIHSTDGSVVRAEEIGKPVGSVFSAAVGFSPTGRFAFVHQEDGRVRLWSAEDGGPISIPRLATGMGTATWADDDRLVVGDARDGSVVVIDVATRSTSPVRPPGRDPATTNLAVDARRGVVVLGADRTIERWSLDRPSEPLVARFDLAPRQLALTAADAIVAVVLEDGSLVFRDLDQARTISTLPKGSGTTRVHASPTGTRLISFHDAGPARLWSARGELVAELARPDGREVAMIAPGTEGYAADEPFSPDGRRLVTVYLDLGVCVWDESGTCLKTVFGSPGSTNKYVKWSNRGQRLVYGTGPRILVLDPNGRLRHELRTRFLVRGIADSGTSLWTLSRQLFATWDYRSLPLRAHELAIRQIVSRGDYFLTGGDDGSLRRFQADGTMVREYNPLPLTVQSAAVSADGRWMAAGSAQGQIILWSVDSAAPAAIWQAPEPRSFKGIAFLGVDPPRVVATGWHASAFVCELGRSEMGRFPLGAGGGGDLVVRDGVVTGAITRFDDSPPGRSDAGVLVWRPGGGVIQKLRMPGSDTAEGLACSNDGCSLAASSSHGEIFVWRRSSRSARWEEPARIFAGHAGSVWCVDFSANGTKLVSCSNDGTARIWSVDDGRCVAILRGHEGAVRSVSFLNGDREVATAGADGYVRRYLVDDVEVLEVARARVAALAPK